MMEAVWTIQLLYLLRDGGYRDSAGSVVGV